ncbi:MAG: rhodanese-like domain-containing protein [Nostocoides sp.]
MPQLIDIPTLAARQSDGGFILDCREPMEYVSGHVPGAILGPKSRISTVLGSLPRDRTINVICQSGNRSSSMTDFLTGMGYDAVSVNGGTSAWVAAGHPVVAGPSAA